MKTSWTLLLPSARSDIRAKIADALDSGQVQGWLTDDGFVVTKVGAPRTRNSWRPRLTGTLRERGRDTAVEVVATVHPFVFGFTLLHALLLFGFAWVCGTLAFSWALPPMRAERDALLSGSEAAGDTLRR
jgi:hypothetical protein